MKVMILGVAMLLLSISFDYDVSAKADPCIYPAEGCFMPIPFHHKSFRQQRKTPPSRGSMMVSKPDTDTSWQHGESGYRIEWSGLPGALIKIELFRDDDLIDEISGWTDNNGSYYTSSSVDPDWGSGTRYQLTIIDNTGNQIWSEYFQIEADMRVTSPGWDDYWATGQSDIPITWEGAQGIDTRIELRKEGTPVEELSSWSMHSGYFELPFQVSSSWGNGPGYQVYIEDDLGNSATSFDFIIYPINITEPAPGTTLRVGDPVPYISWSGAHTVVRIELQREGRTLTEISGWMDDTGSFSSTSSISSSWTDVRDGEYRIAVIDDLGNIGIVEPVKIYLPDDSPEGAIPLSSFGSDRLDSADDVDYWVVDTQYGNMYKISSTDTTAVRLRVFLNDGHTPVSGWTAGPFSWQSTSNGEYLIKVIPKNGFSGEYHLEFGRAYGGSNQ